jgi:D-serine deaminase-like pyridoxal phosphate-dependent protein
MIPLLHSLNKTNPPPNKSNVLYGIPLIPSQIPRLTKISKALGPAGLSLMIDHPDQLPYLETLSKETGYPANIFVKVDTGYHRAGLPPLSLNKNGLLEKISQAETAGTVNLLGLYSHSSLSYNASTPEEAMGYLIGEIRGCRDALQANGHLLPKRELVLSVGATPQVVSSQNLGLLRDDSCAEVKELRSLLSGCGLNVELHAGVYPILDMQQVCTNAVVGRGGVEDEIALSVLSEVCSVYNDGEREFAEALVAAGTLALGREPCGGYEGWGVVSSWRRDVDGDEGEGGRLIVKRISQEHAVVGWEGGSGPEKVPLRVGQVIKIYPNHACVTGAYYGWYFVVDSDLDGEAAKVVDVWVRARGCAITDPLLDPRSI